MRVKRLAEWKTDYARLRSMADAVLNSRAARFISERSDPTLRVYILSLVLMIVAIRRSVVELQATATAAEAVCIGFGYSTLHLDLRPFFPNSPLRLDFER